MIDILFSLFVGGEGESFSHILAPDLHSTFHPTFKTANVKGWLSIHKLGESKKYKMNSVA